MPLHLKELLVRSDRRPMDRSHAGFFLEQVDRLLLFISAWPDSLSRSINNILVNRAHIEARIFSESTCFRLRLILIFKAVDGAAVIGILRKIGGWSLLLGITKL